MKNYAVRHVDAATQEDEQFIMKVRGIELTHAAKQRITFELMRKLITKKFGTPYISCFYSQ